MKGSNTQSEPGIPQGCRTGRQSMLLDRFDSPSAATAGPLQAVEPLLDCAAAVLGGLHPKTVERWAREGRIHARGSRRFERSKQQSCPFGAAGAGSVSVMLP
jgi:hypothetical protein